MATNGLVFPVPLPVIMKDEGSEPPTLKEQRQQTTILSEQNQTTNQWKAMAGQQATKEDKMNKKLTVWGKLQHKVNKDWDRLKVFKYFKKMFRVVGKMLMKIGSLAGGFLSSFLNSLMELMLYAAVDPNGSLLVSFIKALIPLFFNLAFMIINMLASVIPMFIRMFVKMLPRLIKMIITIVDEIIKLVPVIIDALIVAIPMILDAIIKLIPKIIEALTVIVPELIRLFIIVIPKIVQALGLAIIGIADIIGENFKVLEPITNFIKDLAKLLMDLFDPTKGDLKTRIISFISGLGTLIIDGLANIFGFGSEAIKDFGKTLSEMFPEFAPLINFITDVYSHMFDYISKFWMLLKGVFSIIFSGEMFDVVKSFIKQGILIFQDFFSSIMGLFNAIMDLFDPTKGTLTDRIMNFFSALFDFVVNTIKMIFFFPITLITDIFKNFKKYKKLIDKAIDAVLNMIGNMFGDDIKNKLRDAFSGVKAAFDKIGNIFTNISNFISDIKNLNLIDYVRNAFKKALNNIPALRKIKDFFAGILRKIQNSTIGKFIGLGGNDNKLKGAEKSIDELLGKSLGGGASDVDDRLSKFITSKLKEGKSASYIANSVREDLGVTNDKQLQAIEKLVATFQAQFGSASGAATVLKLNPNTELGGMDKLISAVKNINRSSGLRPNTLAEL